TKRFMSSRTNTGSIRQSSWGGFVSRVVIMYEKPVLTKRFIDGNIRFVIKILADSETSGNAFYLIRPLATFS
ncbi:MAG TPA: hypothetical protein PKO16_04980, partial [Bacteroidia bacterium]|nr:hypothetical protein [Bacteroidia bacterium]